MTRSFRAWALTWAAGAYRRWAVPRSAEDLDSVWSAAWATVRRKRYALLATRAEEGVHGRVVQPHPPNADFETWIGTRTSSRKVHELERDPRATLVYQDDARVACVTLIGGVTIHRDLPAAERRFMPAWHAFWPEGRESPDFVNLRFRPEVIEVWDGLRGITPPPFGLASARLVRRKGGWDRER
jgi:general stress protein 26